MRRFGNFSTVLLLIVVLMSSGALSAENPIKLTVGKDTLSIQNGTDVLMRYRYNDVPFKPCVQQLFSPAGINILRDSPADHKHHHALMFAIAVDGVNFWEEQKAPGRQVHKKFDQAKADKHNGKPFGGFVESLDWVSPKNEELLLEEVRKIKVCHCEDFNATLLSWQSSLSVPSGKESVTLTGSHYFGLGMRFLESMDVNGQFRNAQGTLGEVVRGDERLSRSNWCAYTATANGKPVTIAMFGHPDNVRDPTQWFTMAKPFAYLSATLNLHREPLKIAKDNPLVLRYAIALWDDQVQDEQISELYQRWIKDN